MSARTLMIQGTGSDAGKSTLVAGLCRVLKRRGVRVAPFKPQNMALNSAVTVDGGEIGRAQALQAQAAGIAPVTDLNPVLLKPSSDRKSQVIIHGRARAQMDARDYQHYKSTAREAVLASYERLRSQYEFIVVEGAGSPAEINLRRHDIANMGFAAAVDCPVALIADIDRGGVFAQLVGTLALLAASERQRVRGFIINRFRGDLSLLEPGLEWLRTRTRKRVFGVLPYLHGLRLDAEDSIAREHRDSGTLELIAPNVTPRATVEGRLRVVVPVLPRISNHTDFDPLRGHPQVELRFVELNAPEPADLIILPGSKSVRADLAQLLAAGWLSHLQRHLRYGGKLLGICGGFQMLGHCIADPLGIEDTAGDSQGFGWLDLRTVLRPQKQLRNVRGTLRLRDAQAPIDVSGYEIHAGVSEGAALEHPLAILDDGRPDGTQSDSGQIMGTYLHGLFEKPEACAALLRWAGLPEPMLIDHTARREQMLERLADTVEASLDLTSLLQLPPTVRASTRP